MLLEHTTIKEIAERANVSTATVSRILNGKHCHRSSTVETVRRAIEELRAEGPVLTGFETAAAESVGIMMFSYRDFLNTNYTATLVTAMVEALTAEDLSVQLLTLSSKRLSIGYIESMIRAHRLRGLLIPEFDILYAISEKLVKLPIPVIGIGNLAEPGLPNCVCADNTATAPTISGAWGTAGSGCFRWRTATSASGSGSPASGTPFRSWAATRARSGAASTVLRTTPSPARSPNWPT